MSYQDCVVSDFCPSLFATTWAADKLPFICIFVVTRHLLQHTHIPDILVIAHIVRLQMILFRHLQWQYKFHLFFVLRAEGVPSQCLCHPRSPLHLPYRERWGRRGLPFRGHGSGIDDGLQSVLRADAIHVLLPVQHTAPSGNSAEVVILPSDGQVLILDALRLKAGVYQADFEFLEVPELRHVGLIVHFETLL